MWNAICSFAWRVEISWVLFDLSSEWVTGEFGVCNKFAYGDEGLTVAKVEGQLKQPNNQGHRLGVVKLDCLPLKLKFLNLNFLNLKFKLL